MTEFLNKHTIKIQAGAAFAIICAVAYWAVFGIRYIDKVDAQGEDVDALQQKTEVIPIMQTDIQYIKNDVAEIKGDIKSLLNRK